MVFNNLVVDFHALNSVAEAYVNVINATVTFFEPTPPTNIITNETILTQYSIKQGLNMFGEKGEVEVQKEFHQFHGHRVVDPNNPQELSY